MARLTITYYITAREQLAWERGHLARNSLDSLRAGKMGTPAHSDALGSPKMPALPAEQALKQKVRDAFSAGIDYVQVREKDLPARRLAALLEELASCPEKSNSRLLVNERLDIAVSCGADGVHLPSGSLPVSVARRVTTQAMILGVSCHNEEEAAEAAGDGASYILLAPIFETPSKPGARPLGLPVLERVCRRSRVPVYALGGVDAANAADCIRAGASGVAGIRLFQEAPDLKQLCRRLRALENSRWGVPRIPGALEIS